MIVHLYLPNIALINPVVDTVTGWAGSGGAPSQTSC